MTKATMKKNKVIRLNLGSGVYLRKGYINVDKFLTLEGLKSKEGWYKNAVVEKGAEFVQSDILKMPFPNNYADYVLMSHVIEHFPMYKVIDYMKEVYRVMKKGAKLIVSTNSFTGLTLDWLQLVTSGTFDPKKYYYIAETIYGNQAGGSEGEIHMCPFTPDFMNYVLFNAGFKKGEITLLPKGSPIPTIGEDKPIKGVVTRNDQLIVETYK